MTNFLIYLPNYRKIAPSPLCGARASQPCSPPHAQHGTLQPATGHTVRHSLPPYATRAAILRLFSSWVVAGWYFAALAQHRQHALTRWPRPPVALLTLQMKRTRCTYSKCLDLLMPPPYLIASRLPQADTTSSAKEPTTEEFEEYANCFSPP